MTTFDQNVVMAVRTVRRRLQLVHLPGTGRAARLVILSVREVATGTITGLMTIDHVSTRGTGVRTTRRLCALVLAAALLVGIAVVGLKLAWALLAVLGPLAGLMFVYWILFGRTGSRGGSDRPPLFWRLVGHAARGTASGVAALTTAPLRYDGLADPSTELHRFRVTEPSGQLIECELLGELRGAQLRPGDLVEIRGHRTRHGTVRVRRVVLTASGAAVTARAPLPFNIARLVNAGAIGLCVATVLIFVVLRVSG
jgi:hypothetical protein